MKKLLVLLLLALSPLAPAQQTGTALLSWVNATQNEDGTEIPSSGDGALAYTTIKFSQCVNGDIDTNPNTHYVSIAHTGTIVSTEGPAGDYCFRGTHTNSYGTESVVSNLVVKTVTSPGSSRTPATPNSLATLVVSDLTVYTIIRQEDKFLLLPVGTVPPNTQCDATQKINDHYVVPISAVTLTGTVEPVVVVAKCS